MQVVIRTTSPERVTRIAEFISDSVTECYAFASMFAIGIHDDVEVTTIRRQDEEICIGVAVPEDVNRVFFDHAMRSMAVEVVHELG